MVNNGDSGDRINAASAERHGGVAKHQKWAGQAIVSCVYVALAHLSRIYPPLDAAADERNGGGEKHRMAKKKGINGSLRHHLPRRLTCIISHCIVAADHRAAHLAAA